MPALVRQAFSSYIGGQSSRHRGTLSELAAEILMLTNIYNEHILELAANIPRQGRLEAPDVSAKAHSKLCGSTIIVDIVVRDGQVVDFAHDVKACALSQAAASIMARNIIGSTAAELRELREKMRAMLKENGAPPDGKWAEMSVLEPVRDFKPRHASTMLTFDATVDALNQLEKAQAQTAQNGIKEIPALTDK